MKYFGSKTLETKRLILHKTEEKDLKELWNILCIDCVNKYYLTSNFILIGKKKYHIKCLN